MEITLSILLGVLSSILATLVWVIGNQLYDAQAKSKNRLLLDVCDSTARLLISASEFGSFPVTLSQVERLSDQLMSVHQNIHFLNFFPKKRKLMKTLIYNMLRVLSIFKQLSIGYVGEQEFEARCERFSNRYLYTLPVHGEDTESFLVVSISLLSALNEKLGLKKALRYGLEYYGNEKKAQKDILSNLIEINSFRDSTTFAHLISKEGLSQKTYNKIIETL